MPCVDKPLTELQQYQGITPRPTDFDEYWARALKDLDQTAANPEIIPSNAIRARAVKISDLYFTGVGGARVYAKLYQPKEVTKPGPAVLFFHGYSGNGGNWSDLKLALASQGHTVAALDCRGQGGRSEDTGNVRGMTLRGHFVRGLDDHEDKLLFRQIFLDTAQLARVVMDLPGVDSERVGCYGASQGGALSLVCASLEPRIKRCVSLFPFLSDYRRVWEMDLAKDAYDELKYFFRMFDPRHEREDEIFYRLGYIDIQNLANRIQAQVIMAVGLMDTICPPSTQFAAFNKIQSKKETVIFPDFGHENLPGFEDTAYDFLYDL